MSDAIYNSNNKEVDELPLIFGFNNGGRSGWLHAQLLAENGAALGSHLCSSEGFMYQDLGILEGTRPDRHEGFKKHYPDGYRMKFVQPDDERLLLAYEKNQQQDKVEVRGS